jgi:hypothetical protein
MELYPCGHWSPSPNGGQAQKSFALFYLNEAMIAQSVEWQPTVCTAGVQFLVGARAFSLLNIQNGFGAHPLSFPVVTRYSYPGVEQQGQEWWNYTSVPPYIFMAWCIIKHKDNLTNSLYFYLLLLTFFLKDFNDNF